MYDIFLKQNEKGAIERNPLVIEIQLSILEIDNLAKQLWLSVHDQGPLINIWHLQSDQDPHHPYSADPRPTEF